MNIGNKFSHILDTSVGTSTAVPLNKEPVVVKDSTGKSVGLLIGDGVTQIKNLQLIGKPADLSNYYTKTEVDTIIDNIPETDLSSYYTETEVNSLLSNKVDVVAGKGLSSNDYTTLEKDKLSNIAPNANNYVHPTTHSIAEVSGLQEALDTKVTLASTLTGWLAATADAVLSSTSTLRAAIEILDWRTKNIDGAKIVSGTVPDARLSSNIPLKNAINVFTSRMVAVQGAGGEAYGAQVNGEASRRWRRLVDGKEEYGDGTGTFDTFLERLSAGWLKLTGGLNITGNLDVNTIRNTSSFNNSHILLTTGGAEVKTSIAGNIALKIINTITTATGALTQWIKGSTVVASVSADGVMDATNYTKAGVKTWVDQTYINPAFTNVVNDVPPTEMAKLTTANWTNGNYTGEPIINTTVGMSFVSGTYRYVCDEDNVWSRLTRV